MLLFLKEYIIDTPQLRQCTEQASRRGSRSISTDDLIFLIRHDQAKVSRLRTFLSWKDVRKNVKDSDDKGGDADIGPTDDPAGAVPGGPVVDTAKKNKKAKVGLPWEVPSFYNQEVPEREEEEDEDEEEMNYATLQRLKKADERTKIMTKEEYVTWSEYRQASFTFRKGKRFKEWAGFGVVTDSKPNDDIVDILGFLTFEIVQTLTEEALKIKEAEDLVKDKSGGEQTGKKRKIQGLFDPPSEGRTPVEPRHIQEAFRRLQQRPNKQRAMCNFTRGLNRTPLKLVSNYSSTIAYQDMFTNRCIVLNVGYGLHFAASERALEGGHKCARGLQDASRFGVRSRYQGSADICSTAVPQYHFMISNNVSRLLLPGIALQLLHEKSILIGYLGMYEMKFLLSSPYPIP